MVCFMMLASATTPPIFLCNPAEVATSFTYFYHISLGLYPPQGVGESAKSVQSLHHPQAIPLPTLR